MFTVSVAGVVQRLQFTGVAMDSQLPPAPVIGLTVNRMLVPVLVISRLCGGGFVLGVSVAKLRACRWTKTEGST